MIFFPRKQDLTFHANWLLRQFAWNFISCFLGKKRKIFQNVVCWKIYPECWELRHQVVFLLTNPRRFLCCISSSICAIVVLIWRSPFFFLFVPHHSFFCASGWLCLMNVAFPGYLYLYFFQFAFLHMITLLKVFCSAPKRGNMRQCSTKPTKWHVRPAKTQIRLGLCFPHEESLGP